MKSLQAASEDNIAIAKEELEMAKSQLAVAKGLEKAARMKHKLVKHQLDLARLEEALVLKEIDLVKKKMAFRSKGILSFKEENLDILLTRLMDEAYFAKLQGDAARLNKKIAALGVEIAREKTVLAKRTVSIANARKTLGRAQQELVKNTGAGAGDDTINSDTKRVKTLERAFKDEVSAAWMKQNDIRQKSDVLAGLTKALALKLADVDAKRSGKE